MHHLTLDIIYRVLAFNDRHAETLILREDKR